MNITYQHDALNLLADALKNQDIDQAMSVRDVMEDWLMDDDEKNALLNLANSIINSMEIWEILTDS